MRIKKAFFEDIKVSHSIFAIPFVVVGLVVENILLPSVQQSLLILICLVSARSFAMGMNRLIDADIDALNMRTSVRAIPSGRLSKIKFAQYSLFFGLIFVVCAWFLSPLAGYLSLPLLLVLAGYSYMKRLSYLTHWYLGICLGLAPIAAVIGLTGQASPQIILLGLAIGFWVAGFDLLYSLQDREFDASMSLKSVPACLGTKHALILSILSFFLMIVFLLIVGEMSNSGPIYFVGVVLVAFCLLAEHWLIRDAWKIGVSKNINSAFFNVNAIVSVLFMTCVLADRVTYGS